jgi:hypothetical protein
MIEFESVGIMQRAAGFCIDHSYSAVLAGQPGCQLEA